MMVTIRLGVRAAAGPKDPSGILKRLHEPEHKVVKDENEFMCSPASPVKRVE